MILRSLFLPLIALFIFASCSRNPLNVDATETKVTIEYVHLDSIYRSANSRDLVAYHRQFLTEIPEIYEYELGYCLRFANASDSALLNGLSLFLADSYIKQLEKQLEKDFRDVSKFKEDITGGFKYLKFHFPDKPTPKHVVFMNSLFQSSAFVTKKEIGIGIERYLSSSLPVIRKLPGQEFPKWMRDDWDVTFLPRDAVCSWVMTHIVPEKEGNLAEQIIRWGKILYITHAAFPDKGPSHAMRYTEKEYKWALTNEAQFWKYLVDQKMLFMTNERDVANFLREGPFTAGIPKKGPDRLGQFLGYQIVRKYMESTDDSFSEMIKKPYNQILKEYVVE
jgi:hypothetical protein